MAAGTPAERDLDIDVATLFGSLWRSKFKLLISALIITALTAAALFTISPKYKSEARIFIEQGESVFTRPQTSTAQDDRTNFDPEGITSQVQVLSSADVLARVIESPEVAKNAEFKSFRDLSAIEGLMTLINRGPQVEGEDRVIAKLREQLKIYSVENSRVIVVEFASKDPQLASLVPNEVAKAYLAIQSQTKQNSDSKASKFLKAGIDKLEVSLPLAEAAVAEYRSANDILLGQNNAALATQQLSELSSELTRVRAARANASAKAENVKAQIDNGASIDSIPEVLSSGLMQRLRERQVQLKSDIADLSTTLKDGHPQIKGLRSQLADLEVQIRSEIQKVLRSLESEAQTASIREKELANQLNGLKAESSRVGEDEVKLRELEREVAAQRLQLESYRLRYSEALDRQGPDFQTADARIIQTAEVPGAAYFPKIVPSMLAAFVGSLLVLSIIKLLSELFSGRAFRGSSVPVGSVQGGDATGAMEVNQVASAPILTPAVVQTPVSTPDAHQEITINAVAARLIENGETCALIVSPEGNIACASSVLLARELSDKGLRVVLVDLTGNSAAARPMLDGLALPGITNLLAGDAPIASIIHPDSYSQASVIPTGTANTELAAKSAARLPMIINSLISAFDMVIVECGASSVAGVNLIVHPGSGLLISFIDADSKAVMSSMTELIAAGYENLEMVTPVGATSQEPLPGRSAA